MALDPAPDVYWPRHDHRLDRALGVLLGAAIGDALADAPTPSALLAAGPLAAGDRTAAMIAVAELAARGHDQRRHATLERLRPFLDRRRGSAAVDVLCLMPAVALATIRHPQALAPAARAVAALADPDPRAGDAAAAWCGAIRRTVLDGHLSTVGDDPWLAAPGVAASGAVAAWSVAAGAPVPILDPAEGLFPCCQFRDALVGAAALRTAPDALAAAGALLGARWGVSGIPLEWQRRLRAGSIRTRDCGPDSGPGGSPRDGGTEDLGARKLIALAALCLFDGRTDADGWPLAPSMAAAVSAQPPRAVPHPYDPGVVLANVAAVPDAPGFDAVVSLCRVGPLDVPRGVGEQDRAMAWLVDTPGANANLHFTLDEAARSIASFRREGKRVLVHCAYGRSRTPAVAARYAALHLGVDTTEALRTTLAAVGGHMKNPDMAHAVAELETPVR